MKIKISVVIPTKNRPEKIGSCINSIVKNTINSNEILIIDQSHTSQTQFIIKRFADPKVRYFHFPKGGKASALNYGISRAKGNIICFTDDDCLVDKNWLKNILLSFEKNPSCKGVFGRVLPYQSSKPRKNGLLCPCTFNKTKQKLIVHPTYHAEAVGYGNNMAYQREIFNQIGFFKTWLGPNSIGSNAEDAEFALRTLLLGYQILYNPNVLVWHNKWLTVQQMRKQCLSYIHGEAAVYGYYALKGHAFAKKVVIRNIKHIYYQIKNQLLSFYKHKRFDVHTLLELLYVGLYTFAEGKGSVVALYFFLRNK